AEQDRRPPMTETASERIRVEAPADRCFDVAIDFESYPDWAKDVKSARILETDDEGRGKKVEYRAAALGRSIRCVLEYDYREAPPRGCGRPRRGCAPSSCPPTRLIPSPTRSTSRSAIARPRSRPTCGASSSTHGCASRKRGTTCASTSSACSTGWARTRSRR